MVFKWTGVAVVLTGLMSACSSGPSSMGKDVPGAPTRDGPSPPVLAEGVCNFKNATFALGQPVTSRLVEDARVRSGSLYVRLVDVNESVSMDVNPQRLNLLLDATNRVKAVRCR